MIHEYITGGGMAGVELPASLAAEGSAMRRSLVRDFAALDDIDVSQTLDARLVGSEPTGNWTTIGVERETADDILSHPERLCDAILVIAPETAGILRQIALEIWGQGKVEWLGSGSEAIKLAGDKYKLYEHWVSQQIRTPETYLANTPEAQELRNRGSVVIKPIDGAGCLDTHLVDSPGELIMSNPNILIQRFVPGRPMSATFLVERSGRQHLLAVGHQQVEIEQGQFRYLGGKLPAETAYCDANVRGAISLPGLCGLVGIDFLWTDEGSVAIEINPRPTTSVVAITHLLGPGKLARAWLDGMSGPYSGPKLSDLFVGKKTVHFDTEGILHHL